MKLFNNDPISNDNNNPLISIFITNNDKYTLEKNLKNIFSQNLITNFELIIIDDASNDGSWSTILNYVKKFPNRITINRNRHELGTQNNLRKCVALAKGQFYILLVDEQIFLSKYFFNAIDEMKNSKYKKFSFVYRLDDLSFLSPVQPNFSTITNTPLVSILCYNYNYGRYLRQCLESIFSQTYKNIELCFSDNASTDNSLEIALEFLSKYPTKMHFTRNRKNFGPDVNFANSRRNSKGKYYVNLCSDDAMEPEFIEQCVTTMETYHSTGFAIVNRTIINEKNVRTDEKPFYNKSCIIKGEEQAAVYMMAGINPSVSQIMYKSELTPSRSATGALASRYYGTRILDFNLSLDFDVAYIKEPLLLHRIHSQSDTTLADSNLLPIIGLFVLNHQFADSASVLNYTKVTERLTPSIAKLAELSLRYSLRALNEKNYIVAERYFYLSRAMSPQITTNPLWVKLTQYWTSSEIKKKELLAELTNSTNVVYRNISYDPPPGSIFIETLSHKK